MARRGHEIAKESKVICRICMAEYAVLNSLFESFMATGQPLSEFIMSCVSVTILEGDGLPDRVCQDCYKCFQVCYLIRQRAETADAQLRIMCNVVDDKSDESDSEMVPPPSRPASKDKKKHKPSVRSERATWEAKARERVGTPAGSVKKQKESSDLKPEKQGCKAFEQAHAPMELQGDLEMAGENLMKDDPGRNLDQEDFPCPSCSLIFDTLAEFRKHRKIHWGKVLCPHCGLMVSSSHVVEYHQKGTYSCSKCDKQYQFMKQLRRHWSVDHGVASQCNECGKMLKSKIKLERHMKLHKNVFICQFCARSFSLEWNLTQHMRLHTGSMPYVCDICGKKFRHNVTMKQHRARHSPKSPDSSHEEKV